MSQGALADALGVSRQTIGSVENDRSVPSLPLAFAIAKLFKCRIEDLINRYNWHHILPPLPRRQHLQHPIRSDGQE